MKVPDLEHPLVYELGSCRRLWAGGLSGDAFRAFLVLELRMGSAARREPRCLGNNLSCGIRTSRSWCHQHRDEEAVEASLFSIRSRIEAIGLDQPLLGSRRLAEQMLLEARERMARVELADMDFHVDLVSPPKRFSDVSSRHPREGIRAAA